MTGSPLNMVRVAGDGVGPELVDVGSRIIEETGLDVRWIDVPAGADAYERYGSTAPEQTLAALRAHRAAIKGPFFTPNGGTIRSANYYIRRRLDLYACVRPLPVVNGAPPVLLVRENVEDLYGAIEWTTGDTAHAVKVATRRGCRRIASYAFELARARGRRTVTVVHKANNLKHTEGMFLEVATDVARAFPEIAMTDMLADTAAATLVLDPGAFDVILTSNTIGDILSGVGAAVAGGPGMVGSLNSGERLHVAEAGHGHAGDLAGLDRVNPIAFVESVALLLGALGLAREAHYVAEAVARLRDDGPRTLDLGGHARTSDVTEHLCRHITELRAAHA